jgi:fibronectin type 3 domain-containing protein
VYDNVSSSYLTEKIKHPEYITLTAFDTHLAIGWKSSPQWKSVRVIKKESSFPISIHDGKVICDSATGTQCIDKDVTSGKTYYYGVYSVDQTYMTSNLVLVSGALQSKKIVTDTTIPAQQTTATSRVTPVQSTQAQFTKTLRVGSKGQEVLMLQQFLNVQGFVIATSGAGSKGQETTLFGRATESALKAYQCKRKIVCDGSPESTGYGVVGKTTRMYLNNETSLGSVKGN